MIPPENKESAPPTDSMGPTLAIGGGNGDTGVGVGCSVEYTFSGTPTGGETAVNVGDEDAGEMEGVGSA